MDGTAAKWQETTDPRIREIFSDLFELITDGMASGHKGVIHIEPLAYWPGGLGQFEAARSVRKDLTKLTAKS